MLKLFRHKGVAKKVLWVIAVIIIISFGFGFGISRYSNNTGRQNAVAGTIFGQKVTTGELHSYAMAARDQIILMSGPNFEKALSLIDMDNEAWTRIMLVKEADKRGLKATDQEVIAFIRSIPAFQRDGDFDKKLYDTVLAHVFRRNPRDFEESVRSQIRIMKLLRPAIGKVALSDAMIREEYEKRNRKVKVGYVIVDPKTFAQDITVDPKELKTFFDAHREDFLIPESIKLQYVAVPLTAKSSAEDRAKAQASAQEIYQKTLNGGDLSAAAKDKGLAIQETSLMNMEEPDLSLGWPLDFWQKAFAAASGAILAPVTTSENIILAKVAERKAAYIPEFEKAQDTIKERILSEKTAAIAKGKAAEIRKELVERVTGGKSPDQAAHDAGLAIKETPFFSTGEYLPEIGLSENFDTAAMSLSETNRLSEVVETSRGSAILWWEGAQPIDNKKFEEEKETFARALYQETQAKAASEVISEIRSRAKLQK